MKPKWGHKKKVEKQWSRLLGTEELQAVA